MKQFVTAIENVRFEIFNVLFEFKQTEFYYFSRTLFAKRS